MATGEATGLSLADARHPLLVSGLVVAIGRINVACRGEQPGDEVACG